MSKYIDVNALLEVAGITLVVAVGMVLFFSLGVVALNGPREETTSLHRLQRPDGSEGSTTEQRRPVSTRVGAAAAFAACAALAILGLIVLIQK